MAENTRALTLPANPHDDSGNGYTNLEVWLNNYASKVEAGIVALAKGELSFVGQALETHNMPTLDPAALSLTGRVLNAHETFPFTPVALSLTGQALDVYDTPTLVSMALSWIGKALTTTSLAIRRGLYRMGMSDRTS